MYLTILLYSNKKCKNECVLIRLNFSSSPKAHLYASSANLRVVYTPPLYWIPHPGNVTTPLYKSEVCIWAMLVCMMVIIHHLVYM